MRNSIKDTVGGALGIAAILLVSNIVTPLMALGIPRIKNILGIKIDDVRVEHFPGEPALYDGDSSVPECCDIKFGADTLTIYKDDMVISGGGKELKPYSFGFDGGGSGNIGIIIFGIPGCLLAFPLILLFNTSWWLVYKLTDMDVNYYLFFRRIKNQLDADTRATLKEALIKTSRLNRAAHE